MSYLTVLIGKRAAAFTSDGVHHFQLLNDHLLGGSRTVFDRICYYCFAAVLITGLSVVLTKAIKSLLDKEVWSIIFVTVVLLLLVLCVIIIWRQPQSPVKASFMVRMQSRAESIVDARKILMSLPSLQTPCQSVTNIIFTGILSRRAKYGCNHQACGQKLHPPLGRFDISDNLL